MKRTQKSKGRIGTTRQELQDAALGTVFEFHAAWRRFERHRRHRGLDFASLRLLDEAHVARSLALVMADELRRDSGTLRLQ